MKDFVSYLQIWILLRTALYCKVDYFIVCQLRGRDSPLGIIFPHERHGSFLTKTSDEILIVNWKTAPKCYFISFVYQFTSASFLTSIWEELKFNFVDLGNRRALKFKIGSLTINRHNFQLHLSILEQILFSGTLKIFSTLHSLCYSCLWKTAFPKVIFIS